jgi:hypothetical protein
MRKGVWIALIVVLAMLRTVRAAAPQQIDAAIESGVKWLYSQQNSRGHWEQGEGPDQKAKAWQPSGGQWGGTTALAVYALLASGESAQDPRLVRAIEFLSSAKITGVYALAMRAQVWQRLPRTPQRQRLVLQDAQALRAMLIQDGPGRGFFDYAASGGKSYSHSRGNYGVLGLWAVAQAGVEVPSDVWQTVEQGWVSHQDPSGGWTYKAPDETEHPVTPGMTAAGVASLFITQDMLAGDRGADCKPVPPNQPLERGLTWLADHFDAVASDQSYARDYPYATLYAVERVGMAGGLRTFGRIDWYERGADWLLRRQASSGAWAESRRGDGDVVDTAFALLFLSRGQAPVVMAKLDYTEDSAQPARWNSRPRDVANLVRWIGSAMERDLSWHIVPTSASLPILHEAPILYLAGRDKWTPSQQLQDAIRDYIQTGGLVMACGDCGGEDFATSIRSIGEQMFAGRRFRELPADHPIYTRQQFARSKWKSTPRVQGLSNGVRELILLIPEGDPGRIWQMNRPRSQEHLWQLGADIVQYAAGQQDMRKRGATHLVQRDPSVTDTRQVAVARLAYNGNWDPEPAGWPRLAEVMHNEQRFELRLSEARLGGNSELSGVPIAYLTGTDALALDTEAKQQLRSFIDAGGRLVIDAAGGSSTFAASAETLLGELLPDAPLRPLPADHAIYSAGGLPSATPSYRRFAQLSLGLKDGTPRLMAIEREGKLIVVYSREDLSAGLVGVSADGIAGYTPQSAADIMSRMLLYLAE